MDPDALRNDQWERLQEFVPGGRKGRRGPRSDARRFFNALTWLAKSGARWRDLPEDRFGPYQTVKRRDYRWIEAGVFERILECRRFKTGSGILNWDPDSRTTWLRPLIWLRGFQAVRFWPIKLMTPIRCTTKLLRKVASRSSRRDDTESIGIPMIASPTKADGGSKASLPNSSNGKGYAPDTISSPSISSGSSDSPLLCYGLNR